MASSQRNQSGEAWWIIWKREEAVVNFEQLLLSLFFLRGGFILILSLCFFDLFLVFIGNVAFSGGGGTSQPCVLEQRVSNPPPRRSFIGLEMSLLQHFKSISPCSMFPLLEPQRIV